MQVSSKHLKKRLKENGCKGVIDYVTRMNEELKMIMAFTGFKTVKDIDDFVLRL